ncbi:MAG: hypothetical protein IJ540_01600 [Prevotella sp.]|nr:hypothetical protein [Prevotella sp.]
MTLGPLIHDAWISDSWRFPFLANAKVLHGDVGLSVFVLARVLPRARALPRARTLQPVAPLLSPL